MPKMPWILLFLSLSAFAGTPAEEVARLKPGMADPAAQEKCQALSEDAKARGVRTLMIAFEGWASYFEAENQLVYAYHWQLGHESTKPELGRFSAGIVQVGVVMPLIRRHGASFEYLLFPYEAIANKPGSVPELCALEWLKVPGRNLAIAGHSFGGDSTVQLADQLEARGVYVDYALTIDPVAQFGHGNPAIHRSRNVKAWDNFYQANGWPTGRPIPEADVNTEVKSTTHNDLAQTPPVQEALRSRMSSLISRSGR